MNINCTDFGDVKVVSFKGKLDVALSLSVETELDKMIDLGTKFIVIDLKDIEYLSSSGLRIFISTMRKLKDQGGRLVLSSITPMVKKIFKIVELEDLFQIYDTVEEALASFKTA